MFSLKYEIFWLAFILSFSYCTLSGNIDKCIEMRTTALGTFVGTVIQTLKIHETFNSVLYVDDSCIILKNLEQPMSLKNKKQSLLGARYQYAQTQLKLLKYNFVHKTGYINM
jgi:hypothetical protein